MTFPAQRDLAVQQGADFDETFTWYTDAPTGGRFVGDWDIAATFAKRDLVRYSGVLYAALTSSTSAQPDTSPSEWVALTAMDLTGYTARMMARRRIANPDTPVLSLTTTPATDGSGITLGGAAGTIRLQIHHATTAALPDAVLQYDLELVAGGSGNVVPFMGGSLVVGAEVTR